MRTTGFIISDNSDSTMILMNHSIQKAIHEYSCLYVVNQMVLQNSNEFITIHGLTSRRRICMIDGIKLKKAKR